MILLRSLIYFVAMVITVVIFASLIALLGGVFGVAFSDRWATRWGKVNLWLQRVICGLSYEIEGLENLPDKACIVMSKHQSAWETIGLRGILPEQQSWVLKQELMQIPLFGLGLRFVKSIPIDRSAGRRAVLQVIEQGQQLLAEGRYVIIFPEGTRTAPGQRKKYGMGGGLLAERSGYEVVPISHNAGVYWRRRGVKKYPGTIRVVIGPPISSGGRKAAEIMHDVEAWIETQQLKLTTERDKS
jgi:1-acyl-sn-glycerol-3-phosphate acyltransferase